MAMFGQRRGQRFQGSILATLANRRNSSEPRVSGSKVSRQHSGHFGQNEENSSEPRVSGMDLQMFEPMVWMEKLCMRALQALLQFLSNLTCECFLYLCVWDLNCDSSIVSVCLLVWVGSVYIVRLVCVGGGWVRGWGDMNSGCCL